MVKYSYSAYGGILRGFSKMQFNNIYSTGKFLTNYFSQTTIQGIISMIGSSITGASKEETVISLVFAILSCITGVKDGQKISELS